VLLDYVLQKFIGIVEGLVIYEENMAKNIEKTLGLVFSQELMLNLVGKGMQREMAYSIVQTRAMQSWKERVDFKELVLTDEQVTAALTPEEIDKIFDYGIYTSNVDYIFKRCGLD
jgi:adenylosuccinate lyase